MKGRHVSTETEEQRRDKDTGVIRDPEAGREIRGSCGAGDLL